MYKGNLMFDGPHSEENLNISDSNEKYNSDFSDDEAENPPFPSFGVIGGFYQGLLPLQSIKEMPGDAGSSAENSPVKKGIAKDSPKSSPSKMSLAGSLKSGSSKLADSPSPKRRALVRTHSGFDLSCAKKLFLEPDAAVAGADFLAAFSAARQRARGKENKENKENQQPSQSHPFKHKKR